MPQPPLPQPKIGQDITGSFVTSYPTPAGDTQLAAILESNIENYLAQLYGSPPPENTNPDKLLVNEVPIDWKHVQRTYASDRVNEDTYNASEPYSGDAIAYPIFLRDYIVRRANYVARTMASALAGLVNAKVTAVGNNYTSQTIGTLSGGVGSGGAVTPIVSNGAIVHIAITAEGNYTVAPTLTITDAGGGSGATATVSVQPATAVLVHEEMIRQPDSPLDGLYVLVRRIYETLPGPWLPFTIWNSWLGSIHGQRRAVLAAPGQFATLSATAKTTYSARDGSAIVSLEIQENNTNGSGDPDNPAFPLFDQFIYEDERGPVTTTSQLVLNAGQTPSIDEDSGTYTHIDYQSYPDNQFLLKKVTESFHIATPQLKDSAPNEDGTVTDIYRVIKLTEDITPGETLTSAWVKISRKAINELIAWEITEQRPIPGNNVTKSRIDPDGLKVQITELMSSAATVNAITTRETLVGTTWTKITSEKVSDLVCLKVTEQRVVPGNTIVQVETDTDGAELTIARTLTEIGTFNAGEPVIASGIWSKIDSEPVGELVAWKIVTSRAVTGNVQAGHRISAAAQGGVTSTSKQLLDATTSAYTPNYLTMSYEDVPVGLRRISRNLEIATDFPVLYDYYRDPLKNNRLVTKSYQIVPSSTSLPSDSAGVLHEIRHGDKYRSLLITTTYSTPDAFTEYRFGAYTMPGLFDEDTYIWSDVCGAFSQFRPEQSMMTDMYTVTEWFDSFQTPQDKFVFLPQSLMLGRGWQMSTRILCDENTFTYTGSCTESYPVDASSPSYSDYISTYQDTDQLVAEEQVLDEGFLVKRTSLYAHML